MKFRTLGQSGLVVSEIGFGTGELGFRTDVDAEASIHAAFDAGVTLFDTADVYGEGRAETVLAKALGTRRKDVVIATKWGVPFGLAFGQIEGEKTHRGASRDYILRAVERSLRHLNSDYIDLYQLHYPDKHTPAEEMVQTLNDLIRQGKIRYYGVSNHRAWQMVEIQLTARQLGLNGLVSSQEEYSLLKRRSLERELLAALGRYQIGLLPYFPLASGMLTGKYRRNQAPAAGSRLDFFKGLAPQIATARNFEVLERLEAYAAERGHTILELAISWLLACPVISSVIAGGTNPTQVRQNVAAGGWSLCSEELKEIDAITNALPEP
jgi:aryl-alcohol dehydrogenase-like predicted oxidoreductase